MPIFAVWTSFRNNADSVTYLLLGLLLAGAHMASLLVAPATLPVPACHVLYSVKVITFFSHFWCGVLDCSEVVSISGMKFLKK